LNVDIKQFSDSSFSSSNSIKIDNSNSNSNSNTISSEILYPIIPEEISSLKDNKNMELIENDNSIQSKNEKELDDFYENFYN